MSDDVKKKNIKTVGSDETIYDANINFSAAFLFIGFRD